ncbi:unnamed protein product [Amaranthus hypochondriacus]
MANAKLLSLLLILLVLTTIATQALARHYQYGNGSLRPHQCKKRCSRRCSKSRKTHECMFFCLKCCAKCLCVPPGTYGNKQLCPCYNNWKTKRGGPKCP